MESRISITVSVGYKNRVLGDNYRLACDSGPQHDLVDAEAFF